MDEVGGREEGRGALKQRPREDKGLGTNQLEPKQGWASPSVKRQLQKARALGECTNVCAHRVGGGAAQP